MKNILTLLVITLSLSMNAQNFEGKGDKKLQIGADFQNNVNGFAMSFDYGLGENISVGFVGGYAIGLNNGLEANFDERINLRARFNANIGNVLEIDDNFDVYPGIGLSLKNFGGHLGFRYFFSDGFGVFTEFEAPFAKYKTKNLTPADEIHNQFNFRLGAVFNL